MTVEEGISEGGLLGTLFYNLLPNFLLLELRALRYGVAAALQIPAAWSSHVWKGVGTPRWDLLPFFWNAYLGTAPLPPACLPRSWPDLEATGAQFLD